jgi:large subunit ribosomal protein L21
MYAIVEIAGQQFRVEKEQEVFVHRLEGKAGDSVEFDNVLLLDNGGKVTVGTPVVDDAQVKAKIIEHLKGDKVMVFHKKRRKGYQKENGHRQYLSKIVIEDILTGVKKEKKEAPKAEVKKAAPKAKPKASAKAKAEDKKDTAKAETKKPAAKKEVKKATPAKKKAAPKAETKKAAPKAEKKEAPKAKKEDKPEKKEDK